MSFGLTACTDSGNNEQGNNGNNTEQGGNTTPPAGNGNKDENNGNKPNDGDNTGNTEHTHTYGDWQVVTSATCTVEGEQKRTCSCGDSQTEKIPALGHTEVVDEAVSATCTEAGKSKASIARFAMRF